MTTEALKTPTTGTGCLKFALVAYGSFILNPAAVIAIFAMMDTYSHSLDGFSVGIPAILITNLVLVIYFVWVRQKAVAAGLVAGLVVGLLCGYVVGRALAEAYANALSCAVNC